VSVARARALDGARDDVRAAHAEELLRRRRRNLEIAAVTECREWRGGDGGQTFKHFPAKKIGGASVPASRPVSSLAPPRQFGDQPLRQVDLVNVAGADVTLGAFDAGGKIVF